MRYVVVGGGIVGLATARLLASEDHRAEVLVLEKETTLASHQTGRNSGVVHAGIYYEPGSLKARLCARGRELLQSYCAARGLAYDECGKVVVATSESELGRLAALRERAERNDVPGIRMLDAAGLSEVEPHARGVAALHSPRTAIADFRAIAEAFAGDVTAAGGTVRLGAEMSMIRSSSGQPVVELVNGETLFPDRVLVCAGLHADRLAVRAGEAAEPRIVPFRGEYWQLRPDRAHLVRSLIYPVPDPRLPFLGVHLTRHVDGRVLVGPNAVLATAREGYSRRDVELRELASLLAWRGAHNLARSHWRSGLTELARSASKRRFVAEARRYVPALRAADVVRAPAGVRAQAVDRDGSLIHDFRLSRSGSIVWVRNAPSPAATASMAIAEELAERLRSPSVTKPTRAHEGL